MTAAPKTQIGQAAKSAPMASAQDTTPTGIAMMRPHKTTGRAVSPILSAAS